MISIAMATYNGHLYIKQQIDSILRQTIKDFELVISDDNSSDQTIDIIEQYNDNRIVLIKNKENQGFVKNFENALKYCHGDYIAFSDQDDIWEDNHLEILLGNLQDKSLSCSDSELIDENGIKTNVRMSDVLHLKKIPASNIMLFTLLNKNFVQGSTVLFKRDLLKKALPIPEDIKYHDHWIALFAANNGGIAYTQHSTLQYRQHSAAITKDKAWTLNQKIKYHKENKNRIQSTYYYYYTQAKLFLERDGHISEHDSEILLQEQRFLRYRGEKKLSLTLSAMVFYLKNYKNLYYDKSFIYFFLRFASIFF